jgi:HEPN domain-containing protein
MDCQSKIVETADLRIKEAGCLLENSFWNGAYYLAGYAVELMLKASVCKTLGIDDFFTFKGTARKDLYKPYKVHNFQELLILSGIFKEVEAAQADTEFKAHWSLVCQWSEESRYLTDKNEKDVNDFVTSVKVICEWIKKKL